MANRNGLTTRGGWKPLYYNVKSGNLYVDAPGDNFSLIGPIATGTPGATALPGLTDVTITAPQPGQILGLDPGGQWINIASPSSVGATPPSPATLGQIWVDTRTTPPTIKVWNGTTFVSASSNVGATPPTPATLGQIWVDTSTAPPVVKVYDGTTFVPVSTPAATTAVFGLANDSTDFPNPGTGVDADLVAGLTTNGQITAAADLNPGDMIFVSDSGNPNTSTAVGPGTYIWGGSGFNKVTDTDALKAAAAGSVDASGAGAAEIKGRWSFSYIPTLDVLP